MAGIQTTEDDAKARATAVPPQLVEDVQADPEVLRPVARSMAAINLHNLFARVQHPATPNKDRLELQALLNKMAGLDTRQTEAPGSGFSITINIPQVGETKGAVIEATAASDTVGKLAEHAMSVEAAAPEDDTA